MMGDMLGEAGLMRYERKGAGNLHGSATILLDLQGFLRWHPFGLSSGQGGTL